MIRTDTKDFPFSDRTDFVWYFILGIKNGRTKDFYNVSGKKNLVQFLKKVTKSGNQKGFVLFGVWPGKWRTDVFKIKLDKAYKELSKYFSS